MILSITTWPSCLYKEWLALRWVMSVVDPFINTDDLHGPLDIFSLLCLILYTLSKLGTCKKASFFPFPFLSFCLSFLCCFFFFPFLYPLFLFFGGQINIHLNKTVGTYDLDLFKFLKRTIYKPKFIFWSITILTPDISIDLKVLLQSGSFSTSTL